MWGFLGSVPGSIGRFFGGVGGWLWGHGADLLHGLANGAANGAGAVWGFLSSIPGRVGGWFGDAASWLYGAGQSIVSGLINGISSMIGAAANAAANLAKSALDSAKSFLGIGSPSKMFHEVGLNVGRGMSGGLDASRSAVAEAASRMAGATTGSHSRGSHALAGVGSAPSNGRTVPLVHIEKVESTVDFDMIARQAAFRERAGQFA